MKKLLSLFTALLLCTAMWGDTYKTFYKIQGALYQGINNDFTTNKNLFVPNGASVTFTTSDGGTADWYRNGEQKQLQQSSYKISNLADVNYYKPQIKNHAGSGGIEYIYGSATSGYYLRAGSGTMYMMSMANAYCVCTESSTASNVGVYYVDNKTMLTLGTKDAETYGTSMKYGTNFNYSTYGAVQAYEMLVDNPGEMYIDYIVLPIFGYPKTDATTINQMIPEGKKLTLTLYPIDLTLATDGKYSYTRKTPAITMVTADAGNFTESKSYNGTVKFDLSNNPVLISGDFVARLTWDDGCDFGLITDNYNLQNYTTWYIFANGKTTMWTGGGRNASISYHAMFPVLESKDESTELTIPSTGTTEETEKTISFKSNINPKSNDFEITTNDTWITIDKNSITYSETTGYKQPGTNNITFTVAPNDKPMSDKDPLSSRYGVITLKHHGKVLTYKVSQAPMINQIVGFADAISLKKGDETNFTATVLPETTDQAKTVTWSSSADGVATVGTDGKVTAKGVGTAIITAQSDANSTITKTCTVTVYEVTPEKDPTTTTLTAQPAGGETTVAFTLSGATFNEANWSVTENPDWITETAFTSTKGDNSTTVTCTLTAAANATVNKRSGTIKIQVFGGKYEFEYTITQEPMQSAFYNLPEGAFGCGMTTTGGLPVPYIVAPYIPGKDIVWTSTTGAGKWTVNSDILENSDTYTMSNVSMKGEYNIPMLEQEGKRKFQFGIQSEETYRTNTKFRVGDPVARYITPALMFTDLASRSSGQAHTLMVNYKTTERDVMGVYFNNTDVMYIDGISIPIKNNTTGATVDDMFPNDAHVIVNIYKATSISGKDGNEADKDNPLWTGKLTKDNFSKSSSAANTGALNATFGEKDFPAPIFINGPFVVELSDMKNSECNFYVYSSQVHSGTNEWGYYIKDDVETYPGDYTLAVSVHAMFPVLESKDAEQTLEFASTGEESKEVTIISNIDPKSEDFTVDFGGANWISKGNITYDETSGESTLTFTAAANDGADRSTTITLKHHGKELAYTVTQEAALEPEPIYIRPVTSGNWGTICLDKKMASFIGIETLYKVEGFAAEKGIALLPIEPSETEAGKPYIFKANENQIEITMEGEAVTDTIPYNHFIGSFTGCDVPAGMYILINNLLYKTETDTSNKIGTNRAYFDVDNMEPYNPATAPARVVFFGGRQSPTGLEVQDARCTMHDGKYLINGQFVIIKDNKMYNAQGIEL